MPRTLLRVRFAVVTAAVLGLLVSGVAIGAAGSALIIGSQTNNAGTSDTQLITNSSVIAFKLLQNGPGTALMGYATPASGANRGVYGRSDSPPASAATPAPGAGAGLQAFGGGTGIRDPRHLGRDHRNPRHGGMLAIPLWSSRHRR